MPRGDPSYASLPCSTGFQPVSDWCAARGCPCPVAGRLLRASCPPLARCCPRFAILASLGQQRRLPGHGQPLADPRFVQAEGRKASGRLTLDAAFGGGSSHALRRWAWTGVWRVRAERCSLHAGFQPRRRRKAYIAEARPMPESTIAGGSGTATTDVA